MNQQMTPQQFEEMEGLSDWRVIGDGAAAFYRSGSFAASVELAEAIARIPGIDEHPPSVDIRAPGVTVRIVTLTDEFMGMTARDVEIARHISAAAAGLGMSADPSAVQSFVIIPGARDTAAIMPFWRAVLGYEPRPDSPDEDLVDPQDRNSGFWFEEMNELRADGKGSIHIGVWVPREQARARVEAALAAGGRMVRDEFAPAWWTLADPAGNEADISTIAERG